MSHALSRPLLTHVLALVLTALLIVAGVALPAFADEPATDPGVTQTQEPGDPAADAPAAEPTEEPTQEPAGEPDPEPAGEPTEAPAEAGGPGESDDAVPGEPGDGSDPAPADEDADAGDAAAPPAMFSRAAASGITVSPTTLLADGDTVTVSGSFPAEIIQDLGVAAGTGATTGVYVMYCVEGATAPGSAAGRLSGASCDSSRQQYLAAASGPAGATVEGSVDAGVWTFEVDLAVSDSFGAHECLAAASAGEQCGVFVRLYHGFRAVAQGPTMPANLADPYVYDQFVPVTFAPPAGITVSPTQALTDGATVSVHGSFPAEVVQDLGVASGTGATTGVYVMYCVQGATAPGTAAGRLSGASCDSSRQQYLASAAGPAGATVKGSVVDGWWTFDVDLAVADAFGAHECLAAAADGEQCGVFVRLYHGFRNVAQGPTMPANLANPYVFDQFVPLTFAPASGITVSPTTGLADGDTVTVRGSFPAEVVQDLGVATGTGATTGVYVMYCAEGATAPGTAAGRLSGAACDSSRQQYLASAAGPAGATVEGSVADGWWTFEVDLAVADSFGAHECLAASADGEQCGVFVRLYHGFRAVAQGPTMPANLANPYVFDQFVPVTFAAAGGPVGPVDPGTTPPTTPASASISVSPSTLNPEVANTVTITGRGYTGPGAANGVYVVLGESGTWRPGQVPSTDGWVRSLHVAPSSVVGGRFTATITLPAGTLTLGESYGVGTFAAHALALTDRSIDAWTSITLSTSVAGTAVRSTPATTPPSTQGVETDSETFTEGGEYTFTAGGFQPGESGILAVIYSEPTLLADDLTADDAGEVTWTGALPLGLTGQHTFTFQGSVDRGIEIEIAAAEVAGCLVESAEFDWGFKESFRAYLDGSIANGGWTTADGASYATPVFTWADGSGGFDAATGDADLAFAGSVRFTGHGGALDTTIANPRIVIDGDRAVLLLDIFGTTQDGREIALDAVEFATLDLAAAELGGGGDLVAYSGIPATLTEAGAAAFGTYEAGSDLDPIDLRITVDPACVAAASTDDEPAAALEAASAASPLPWILGGVALLAIIALVAIVLVRRSRTA